MGYVGGRVAYYLKEQEPNSNIVLTTRDKSRNLPEWSGRFAISQMDVTDELSISSCLHDKKIDTIIHLAAVNEIDSMKDPLLAYDVNIKGTYSLLHAACTEGIENFMYFSTFHVYGNIIDEVITEETATRPYHPYATTHRAVEDIVTYFKHYKEMNTVIFRLSNGYGYPMDKYVNRWSLVFNDLCRQAVTTNELILKSSGKQERDFISLHDVSRAVYHFLFGIPGRWGDGLYNLGGSCNMSILDVANKISEVYQKKFSKKPPEIYSMIREHDTEKVKPFKYSIEKLIHTNFQLEGNMEYEIFRTMDVCEEFAS